MKRCSDLDIDEYSVKATRTLYIGNLQPEISYQELRDTYSIHGEIIVRITIRILIFIRKKNFI
jgi:RNA recognition motif-containing protein